MFWLLLIPGEGQWWSSPLHVLFTFCVDENIVAKTLHSKKYITLHVNIRNAGMAICVVSDTVAQTFWSLFCVHIWTQHQKCIMHWNWSYYTHAKHWYVFNSFRLAMFDCFENNGCYLVNIQFKLERVKFINPKRKSKLNALNKLSGEKIDEENTKKEQKKETWTNWNHHR